MDTMLDTIVLAIGPRDDDRLDRLAEVVLSVAKPTGARVVITHVFTQAQFTDVGDVSDGIVRVATETDADRVVVSGGTRSPAGKAVFGSTAQNVLIDSPCPVTYVRPESG